MAGEIAAGVGSWDELTVLTARPFRARTRIAPGAALIGDAAGTVHPHVGQGANLALEDAVALGEVLLAGRPLAEYARPRERKLRRYIAFSRFSAGSLDAPNAAWRAVRRSGYLWSRVRPVRRDVVRRMAGLAWS
jgi:2-polyprenyl-6-methoxyphenol hydroxylase-like FAD-dependent oxidoreductase